MKIIMYRVYVRIFYFFLRSLIFSFLSVQRFVGESPKSSISISFFKEKSLRLTNAKICKCCRFSIILIF